MSEPGGEGGTGNSDDTDLSRSIGQNGHSYFFTPSFLYSSLPSTMSHRITAFFQAIFNLSSTIALFLASSFALFLHGVRRVFARSVPVELTLNKEQSAPVSENSKTTIFEMIKEKCPSLYGPLATFRPTWWLPGYVLFRV